MSVPDPDVIAAGAVVVRKGAVLLVHRPKYDDWSFPKGKQDPGEDDVVTAVREVAEETGVEVRLGMPLPSTAYVQLDGRTKLVHYWRATVVGDPDVSTYRANDEIDDVAWVPLDEAAGLLSYRRDRDVLAALETSRKTTPLAVLRHAKALSRKRWDGEDAQRPLTDEGQAQAKSLTPLLAAYGITQVVTSSSTRCVQTVQPYVDEHVLVTSHTARPVRGARRRGRRPVAARRPARGHGADRPLLAPTGAAGAARAPRRRRPRARPGVVAGRAPPQGRDPRRGAARGPLTCGFG